MESKKEVKKKPEKKVNKKKENKKKPEKKVNKKKVGKKVNKEGKGNGKVIIEKDKDDSAEDQNYSEKLNLIISRIKDKSILVNENKIRFGWKW